MIRLLTIRWQTTTPLLGAKKLFMRKIRQLSLLNMILRSPTLSWATTTQGYMML